VKAVSLALLFAVSLALAGCSSDSDEQPSLPVPAKPPSASGVTRGPAMEPTVLLASADDLEVQGGADQYALAARRAGAFVSGGTVVGYSVDDVSGYDLESGEKTWTAKIDMQGGTVCFVSQPDRDVKRFTVVYGKEDFCRYATTVTVASGKVGTTTDLFDYVTVDGVEGGGDTAATLVTYRGIDYILDGKNVVWRVGKDGVARPLLDLERDQIYTEMHVSPQAPVLIAERYGSDACGVDAYRLPSFELAWSADEATMFPELGGDTSHCRARPLHSNPLWLRASTPDPEHVYLVQLDPKTGKVVGRADAQGGTGSARSEDDTFNVVAAANYGDDGVGLPDGDVVLPQVDGAARHSLVEPDSGWWKRIELLLYDDANPFGQETVWSAVTDDGSYVVGTVSDETDTEIVALKTSDGSIAGRWPLPDEYKNGFQVQPRLTLFDGGVVLSRNFERWDYTFGVGAEEQPAGDLYDIGVFRFPERGEDD